MRLRPGHWAALDYAFGVFIALFLYAAIRPGMRSVIVSPGGLIVTSQTPLVIPLGLLLVLVAGLATALRRRRPVLMLGVLLADSAALTAVAGRPGLAPVFVLPAAFALYLVAATYKRRRDAVWVLAAVFVTLVLDAELTAVPDGSELDQPGLMLITLCMIIVWTAGYTTRQRRRYAVRLQDEAASKAVAQERLRIARELHDVVAHSMSVIAVQAGYGQYVIDAQPGDARAALGAIQATSREALDEMRRMLGALRQADDADARQERAGTRRRAVDAGPDNTPERADDTDAGGHDAGLAVPLWPAPGLADLDRLISRTAGAGVRVDVTRLGPPRDLPPSIDLSAYRIVQEALTNVVKHARTSSCRVLLGYRDDELTIEVSDDGAGAAVPETAPARVTQHAAAASSGGGLLLEAGLDVLIPAAPPAPPAGGRYGLPAGLPGAGHGIIGMRERVSLLGGEFSAGPLPGYGFRVNACIPLPPSSA
jgi:signal transduction histidine kinase